LKKKDYTHTYIHNVADFKDESGLWVKTKFVLGVQIRTRSTTLWRTLSNKCDDNGNVQNIRQRCYAGVSNAFESYQEFTDWCQDQYGYMRQELNGRFWSLDKDVLVPGNRIYGPDTCLFVPFKVNNTFITPMTREKYTYPMGVYKDKERKLSGSFYAGIRNTGNKNPTVLGKFDTEMEAHRAWQLAKADIILSLSQDAEIKDHVKLQTALISRANMLISDAALGKETISL
jgi:hypothetical protein